MIQLNCIEGKNKKIFIKLDNITTKQDLEIQKLIKQILYRKEYKPFLQGFNKNIEASYLFYEVLFPIQFWDDIHKQIKNVFNLDLKLNNEEICYNQDINEDVFQEFIDSLKIPEKFDIKTEKYKYQRDCVYKALYNKIGRIEIGTSGGKTFITYLYCKYCLSRIAQNENQKVLIIVPSKLLVTQLLSDFEEYQSLEEDKIIVGSLFSGAKKILNSQVICGTYQTLSNYDKEYFDDFRFIVCDELHRAKAYSIKKEIFDKIREADFFFGMTGTFPEYKTLDYLHIVSMFGGKLFEKTVSQLIDEGVSVPVKINVIKINYKNDSDFSVNLKKDGIVGIDKYRVEKEWFQNHESRNNLVVKLLNHYTKNALILVETVEYGYMIEKLLKEKLTREYQIRIINGQVKNRDQIINEIKQTDSGFILIGTYGTMSTGANIPNIEQIYFIDGGKSQYRIRQSIGRGIRLSPGKENCIVFDFYDNLMNSSFKNHAKERLNIYKNQKLDYKITEVNL